MPKIKVPERHAKFYSRYMLAIVICWLAYGYYFGIFDTNSEANDAERIIYFLGVVTSIMAIAWLRKVEFKCPSCGSHLPKPVTDHVESGDPIYHHCKKCDVLWHVDTDHSE